MARQPRFAIAGVPQHIIQRGNNRQSIFRAEPDYQVYLYWLAEASLEYELRLHAYVLMTNHVHVLATPARKTSIGEVMQSLGRRYVQYFNRRYNRTGSLWEGRYRATVIDSERYFLVCSRYIELNPVRAGLVGKPEQFRWSSYRHNALGFRDNRITDHEIYLRLGASSALRSSAYRALFREELAAPTLKAIRDATNKAWALGDEEFRLGLRKTVARRTAPRRRGRRKKIRV